MGRREKQQVHYRVMCEPAGMAMGRGGHDAAGPGKASGKASGQVSCS